MNVAIFGGGVAGLAAATALHGRVADCRAYERRASGAGNGLGFILSDQAMADLMAVGLPPEAARIGVQLRQFRHYDPAGRLRHARSMPPGWRAMRRADLVAALHSALPDGLVIPGRTLTGLTRDPDGTVTAAQLTSTDPSTCPTSNRVRADLYLAADGARSIARQALFPYWPQRSARVWEIVALARHPGVSAWAGDNFHKFSRPGLAAGLVPVGNDAVVWFIQFDRERYGQQLSSQPLPDLARRLVSDWAHPLPALLAASDLAEAHLWRPVDADLLPQFHASNLVLVGDAAHPLLPFTSQGVAAAIAGVRDLAAVLAKEASVPAALEAYSATCRARCAPYIAAGRELTRQFLEPGGAADDVIPVST